MGLAKFEARPLKLCFVKLAGLASICAALAGCTVERPNPDYVLAREAFNAAEEVDAAKYAPANFHKSEEAYRKALQLYQQRNYKDAIRDFKLARAYAERAELAARIQRQKAGEEGL